MANVIVNFRIDEDLKKDFDKICDELGISMSTAYTMFVKKVVREKRIPFELSLKDEDIQKKDEQSLNRVTAYYEKLIGNKEAEFEAASNE